jgi:hypothetical protein
MQVFDKEALESMICSGALSKLKYIYITPEQKTKK